MKGLALLITSLSALILLFVAMVTPGWLGFKIKKDGKEVDFTMSIFYCKVCADIVKIGTEDPLQLKTVRECVVLSNEDAMERHFSSSADDFRFSEFIVETSLTLISLVIGHILSIIFAVCVMKRERRNLPETTPVSNVFAGTGLTLIIIGGICGSIVCLDVFVTYLNLNEAMGMARIIDTESSDYFRTYFPYSILIMFTGLCVEFVAICLHVACMSRTAGSSGAIVLSPVVSTPTVVVHNSTMSSIPYTQFA